MLVDAIEADRSYDIDCPALLPCGEKDRAGDVRVFNRRWTKGEHIPLVWVPGARHNSTRVSVHTVGDENSAFAQFCPDKY